MSERDNDFTVVKLPRFQRQMIDWLDLNTRHPVFIVCEVDVTEARQLIRDFRNRTGRPLSLTAYITSFFASAIAENRMVQAYKAGRRKIAIFEDVDVAMVVERDIQGFKIPLPAVVRSAERLSPADIDAEIRLARHGDTPQAWAQPLLGPWLLLPSIVRRFVLRRLLANPRRRKKITGTTMVSAAGMFGHGAGWGITPPSYTISLVTGSLIRKPCVVGDGIEPREILGLTIAFDHDIVDGAVGARFAQRFKEMIEDCRTLRPLDDDSAQASTAAFENVEDDTSAVAPAL